MSPRQRVAADRSALTVAGQIVAALVGLALVWGALVVGLLLAGVEPASVNSFTGYDDAHGAVAGVGDGDVADGTVRLLVGLGGLLAALALGLLARAQLPRPRLARSPVELGDDARGQTTVAPRAVERTVEAAALGHPAVARAAGRFGEEELALDLTLADPGDVPGVLRAVRASARDSLETHGLPAAPVHVTLVRLDRPPRRDLD